MSTNLLNILDLKWEEVGLTMPTSYGLFHILFLGLGSVVAFFLAYRLRNISENKRRVVFTILSAFIIIGYGTKLEIRSFVYNVPFSWTNFPFQLCIIPAFLCPIIAFTKNKRLSKVLSNFVSSYSLMGTISAMLSPSQLIADTLLTTLYSFTWHIIVLFISIYMWTANLAGGKLKDFLYATYAFLSFSVVALAINLIHFDVSQGQINAFFIGPKISHVSIIKEISLSCGWYVGSLVQVIFTIAASLLVFGVGLVINSKFRKE